MKKAKRVTQVVLFAASCAGIWTIFGDGWVKIIGVLSVLYMALTTIATAITEGREK